MKSKKAFLVLIVAIAAVFSFSSCVDDKYETPPIQNFEIGKVVTIERLKELCPPGNVFKFVGDTSVLAVVTMDDKSGNLYKEAYIQDATGGIVVRLQSAGGIYQGDSIYLNLKGTTLKYYRKVFQIDSVHVDNNILKKSVGHNPAPKVVTIPELKTLGYQAQLIKLENVQFVLTDTSKTYADAQNLAYGELFLQDFNGNTVMLRTSGYSKFAKQNVPNGSGSIVAIAGRYDDAVQLAIRTTAEVVFNQDRWDDGTELPSGTGTFNDPYNVSAARVGSGSAKWVEGYLVGVMETNVNPFVAKFTGPFATNSNVIIADRADETNIANCLIVQLPIGEVRNAINLANNAGNKGKLAKLRGNLGTYFSSPGLLSADGYWLDGTGINPIPPFFEELFATNLGAFTAFNIQGDQVWNRQTHDGGCAVMSGYLSGTNYANEDWLVSPAISLVGRSNVVLNLREAVNFATANGFNDLKIFISSNYSGGNPNSSGTWNQITGHNRGTGNSWTFVNSGNISLTQYEGQTIHIAFKYVSNSSGAATWQVSRVALAELE
jgi:hypothetical protein